MSVPSPGGQWQTNQQPVWGQQPMPQQSWTPMSTNPYWNAPGQQGFGFQYSPQPPKPQGGAGVPAAFGIVLGLVVLVPLLVVLVGSLGSKNQTTSEPAVTTPYKTPARPRESTPRPTPTEETTTSSPSPTTRRSSAPPKQTPSPEPTPTSAPRRPGQNGWKVPDGNLDSLPSPDSDDPAWKTVQRAPIYNLAWPDVTGCPEPRHAGSMAEMKRQVDAAVECTHRAWIPVFERLGYSTHSLPVYYYEGESVTTPCGTAQAPALYCSANGGSLYFGGRLLRDSSFSAIWIKLMVFHEYGHHIQGQSKILEARAKLPRGNETERRKEIQAECYATGMIRSDDSFALTEKNYQALRKDLQSSVDDGIHGSPESLLYWGMRGFHSESIGGCNTWVVGSEKVR